MMLCSVVLTVCNRQETVERALRSIIAQTYRPLEIVVVDNGSTDRSRDLCAAIIEEEQRDEELAFQLLDQPRKGACAARNMGLQAARGEWIAFFDDDDEMSPNFVEEMHRATTFATTTKNWVLTRTRMVMSDGAEQIREGWENATLTDHILGSLVSTQSLLVRREWLLSIGGWDESLPVWNDYALGALLFCHDSSPFYVEGPFHRIYQHAHSITGAHVVQKTEGMILAFLAIRRTLDAIAVSPTPSLSKGLSHACLALYRRLEIAAGLLRREGFSDLSAHLLSSTRFLFPTSFSQRLVGHFLRMYTAFGGRGAWRIARWGLK